MKATWQIITFCYDSLGQRMRCEISASLLHDPKMLFLDEPTIGLDAVSKIAVRKFIIKELKIYRTVSHTLYK